MTSVSSPNWIPLLFHNCIYARNKDGTDTSLWLYTYRYGRDQQNNNNNNDNNEITIKNNNVGIFILLSAHNFTGNNYWHYISSSDFNIKHFLMPYFKTRLELQQ